MPGRSPKDREQSTSLLRPMRSAGIREDRAVEMGETRPADEPVLETPAVETADATMPNPDPTSTGAAKPRRSRARYRKTAKTAAEPVTDATPATWIRVGPGKFVRADASVPFPVQAQSEEIAVAAYPATDTSESATAPSEIVADGRPETDGPETAIVMDSHPATDGPAPRPPRPKKPPRSQTYLRLRTRLRQRRRKS